MVKKYTYVFFTNAVAGKEDEFNRWYTNRHLPDVVEFPGFIAGRRYRLADVGIMGEPPKHRYLTIYEVETDNPEAFLTELGSRAQGVEMSDAINLEDLTGALWEAITDRVVPKG